MAGVNDTLQLAAALDRRGITVLLDRGELAVRNGRDCRPMPIRSPRPPAWQWSWSYHDNHGTHPSNDSEGTADAIEKFLRGIPLLAGTELLYRMDHIGWTWQQEEDELLERTRTKQQPQ